MHGVYVAMEVGSISLSRTLCLSALALIVTMILSFLTHRNKESTQTGGISTATLDLVVKSSRRDDVV